MRCKILVLLFLIVINIPVFLFAQDITLPTGEQYDSSLVNIDRSIQGEITVNTNVDRSIINWESYSVGTGATARYNQPNSSSICLNRVTGVDPSSILGTITSNGGVFIVNPNGIIFGHDCRIDTAGLVASTLNISDTDFINGNYAFSKQQGKNGYIINNGRISSNYVCLLSQAVENRGIIEAGFGTAILAAGEKMTLALNGSSQLSVVIDEGLKEEVFGPDSQKIESAVKNSGSIYADGGKVILTAKVFNKVLDYAVNNTGLIQANNLVEHDGVVELLAEGAPIINSGTISAGRVMVNSADRNTLINIGKIYASDYITFQAGSVLLGNPVGVLDGVITPRIDMDVREITP